jgi:lipopolysaccharide transport system ATP-binding protein
MPEILVKAENVSKKFCRSLKRSLWYGMQDIGNELIGHRHDHPDCLRQDEFWALRDISFELRRGECLGLIGHNGAGKTTLLRILNGLIKPDAGRVTLHGQVGALIALGVGFNPVLSGRENIYINGAILGLDKRQVAGKLDEIVEFSEIGEFIDAPVQTYSSGMNVRLGFAVAAILLEPDVLFLDEVLAVGDMAFAIKCLNRVRELTRHAAVIFVSHNMQYVSTFCNRIIVLDHGAMALDTPDVAQGIDGYFAMIRHEKQVSGTGAAQVHKLELQANGATLPAGEPHIEQGAHLFASLALQVDPSVQSAEILFQINDIAMNPVMSLPVLAPTGEMLAIPSGTHTLRLALGCVDLNAGKYSFVVVVRESGTLKILARVQAIAPFRVTAPATHWGSIVRPAVLQEGLPA